MISILLWLFLLVCYHLVFFVSERFPFLFSVNGFGMSKKLGCHPSEGPIIVPDSVILKESLSLESGTRNTCVPIVDKNGFVETSQEPSAVFAREGVPEVDCSPKDVKFLQEPAASDKTKKTSNDCVGSHSQEVDFAHLVVNTDDVSSLGQSSGSYLVDFVEEALNISVITDDRAASDVTYVRLTEILPISQQSEPPEHSYSSPPLPNDHFDDDTAALNSGILESTNDSNSIEANLEKSMDKKVDNSELRQQLHQMSLQLRNAQNQIEQLLKEKRSWLQQNTSAFVQPPDPPQSGLGELRGRWLQAKNQAESYKKEKEAMVMKYARSEQKRMAAETRIQELERRLSKSMNVPSNSSTLKDSPTKKSGSSMEPQLSDTPLIDLQTRLNQAEKALNLSREQTETLRKIQASSEIRVSSLETRLSQAQEALKAEQRKTSSQNDTINRLNRSMEAAMKQTKEVNRLREREAERLCAEVSYQEAQERMKRVVAENAELKDRLAAVDSLRQRLTEAEKRVSELTAENHDLMDLYEEIETGKRREDQMSEYTRRLTEHNANLQSEHLVTVQRLEEVTQKLIELEHLADQSKQESVMENEKLVGRVRQLEKQLSEFQSQVERLRGIECELSVKLDREREQAQLTHRRDAARIRDLARQLSRVTQRRTSGPLEGSDTGVLTPQTRPGQDSPGTDMNRKIGTDSRTGSDHSIDSCAAVGTSETAVAISLTNKPILLGNPLLASGNRTDQHSPVSYQHTGQLLNENTTEPDQTALLNKLDRLQRIQVRLTDEVESLQEHCHQLAEEVNKKSQIIQHLLILTDKQSGAVSPNSVDAHRQTISRTGGLMASLYAGRSNSNVPDRDTCLEISQKLQRVLEDTLFKNLTLKENLSTLGLEISSLNSLIGDIRARLCGSCRASTDHLHPLHKTSFSHSIPPASQSERINPEPPTFKEGGVSA
ncbi:hypothetical protein D915_000148 [Fasciola hepatica]|uniref:Uncharacterized protein n=1 Tax=Fasciola hepatica TaxID=6192 RepID=A0A4E0RPM6_FASHE|nr:hypothetical protein D915_000148 [Fasciola hepatica]